MEALSKHLEKNKVAGEKVMTIEELGEMDPEQLAKSLGRKKPMVMKKGSTRQLDGESEF